MVQLIGTRHIWLLRDIHRPSILTTMRPFLSVAKMNSIQVLISLTANHGWTLLHFDVKYAFLHGDLEEVYIDTLRGFKVPGTKGKLCKLKKILYGLKQSPRAWFERFRAAMIKIGYKQC